MIVNKNSYVFAVFCGKIHQKGKKPPWNLNKAHWNKSDILGLFKTNLKSLSQGEQKSEWEKRIINTTLHDLLMFTNFGKVYGIKAYNVPEATKQAKGRALVNLLALSADEKSERDFKIQKKTTKDIY